MSPPFVSNQVTSGVGSKAEELSLQSVSYSSVVNTCLAIGHPGKGWW